MNSKLFLSLMVSTLLFLNTNKLFAEQPDLYIETSTGLHTVCSGTNITLTGQGTVTSNRIASHRWESFTPGIFAGMKEQFAVINTREAGTHIITYTVTDNEGNSFSTQISIRVLELPLNKVLVNQENPAEIKKIHLPASLVNNENNPGNKYQWFRNNMAIEGASSSKYYAHEAGSYRLMVTSEDGCNSYSPAIMINQE